MTPDERTARAFRVRAMLEDGELGIAFDEIKADLHAEWERTHDAAERENIWRAINSLNLVRSKLGSMMSGANDGTISAIRRAK